MIGKVTGRLDHRGPDHVLIDTGGVGYVVQCSERTLAAMPQPGGIVSLYTDLIVREDLLQLIGFPSLAERDWHRLLTSVQGVGARVGLAILGRMTPEALGRALTLGDQAAIRSAPGVGPKLAVRIVTELKDKAPVLMATAHGANRVAEAGEFAPVIETSAAAPAPAAKPRPAREVPATAEAISALSNLGYGFGEAAGAVAEVAEAEPGADTPALIRAALKRLAPKV